MYDVYKRLKSSEDKLLLFKCGNFYIFLDEDCHYAINYVVLKVARFGNLCDKCGFPITSLDSYLKVFKNIGLDVLVIDDYSIYKPSINLTNIDVNNITPIEALNILKELIDG